MDTSLSVGLITFLGGLIGGLGGAYYAHFLRRREVLHSERVARVVERKADVYRRCAAFLRSARGIPIVIAVDRINELADEMLLWASADVYKEFSSLTLKMAKDLIGNGSDWLSMILPTLRAMAKDINPGLELQAENVIPHVTFVDHGSADALWNVAWRQPEEFNKIALLLKQNSEMMGDLVRHRYGDYDSTSNVILEYVRDSVSDAEAGLAQSKTPAEFDQKAAATIMSSFVSHPSKDPMLMLGQIAEFAGLSHETTSAYLETLCANGLVKFGRSPGGSPHFCLTPQGRQVVNPR